MLGDYTAELPDLLAELEGIWRQARDPLVGRLKPRLPDARTDELMAPTELQLPRAARLWFEWHDGAVPIMAHYGHRLVAHPLGNAGSSASPQLSGPPRSTRR